MDGLDGEYAHAGTPVEKHRNVAKETWLALMVQSFSLEGQTFPPSSWPKNKRGLPICVVAVWDPTARTTIDAVLEHKAREARWLQGDAVIPDLRMLFWCQPTRTEARPAASTLRMRASGRGRKGICVLEMQSRQIDRKFDREI